MLNGILLPHGGPITSPNLIVAAGKSTGAACHTNALSTPLRTTPPQKGCQCWTYCASSRHFAITSQSKGLDLPPAMIERLTNIGDPESAAALNIIITDENGRVAVGKNSLSCVCGLNRLEPISSWHRFITQYFQDDLKPPFNIAARRAAKFSSALYGPLAERDDLVTKNR